VEQNHDNLKPVIDKSPILKEIESLSEDLAAIAKTVCRPWTWLRKKRTADPEWLNRSWKC